jgi:APA family basic amino acid/polyamine antiporter
MQENPRGLSAPLKVEERFPRVLGAGSIAAIVVGVMIGSGIFIVPATVAARVGSPLLIVIVWITGGILSLFGALSLAELASAFSETGGIYIYLREAYGPLVAFLFGWTLFLVIDSGSIAALAVAFGSKYLPQFVPMTRIGSQGVSALLIVLLAAVNYLGVRWGAVFQNFLTTIKFAALFGIGAVVFLFAQGSLAHFTAPVPRHSGGGSLGGFGLALVATLWAYKGFETSTFNAGETKNPAKNLPFGILAGSAAVVFLYLLANAAYLYALPVEKIAASDRIAADVMNAAVGPVGASIISLIILFSITGALNGHVLTGPRVYFAMAADGLFFSKMAAVHPRFRTPYVSILVVSVWSVFLSLSGTFEELLTFVVFGHWIFMGLAVAAVPILRSRRPELARPYRALGYPVTPAIFVLAALFITGTALAGAFWNCFAGLALILLGVPVFFYWNRKRDAARATS